VTLDTCAVQRSQTSGKLAAIRVIVLFDSQLRAEVIEHPNDLGCMPFGEQIDL